MRLLPCLAALGVACGGPAAITVTANPSSIPGDGETPVTVVANVTKGGSPADGANVHFSATAGSFKDALEGTPTVLDVATTEGKAIATFVPPRQGGGKVTITAVASVEGEEPKIDVSLPLVPSGGLASTLSFSCNAQNIGAFVTQRQTPIHLLCTATARDSQNKIIGKASVQTLSEAGDLDWALEDSGAQEFVYSVRPDAAKPKDVDPMGPNGAELDSCPPGCSATLGGAYDSAACPGEPCWTDPAGNIHNPRDGVVTLIAVVPGVKDFDNQGEPYVDANDNGDHDPGEAYIDYNGNGKWDPPDGKQKDRLLWKAYRVVWSGEADRTQSTHTSFVKSTVSGTGGTALVRFHDINYNALAATALAGGDAIDIAPGACVGGSEDGTLTTTPAESALMSNAPGIAFANDGSISLPGKNSTYLQHTDYSIGVHFSGTADGQTCGIDFTPNRLYDAGAPGFDADGSLNIETIGGSFHF